MFSKRIFSIIIAIIIVTAGTWLVSRESVGGRMTLEVKRNLASAQLAVACLFHEWIGVPLTINDAIVYVRIARTQEEKSAGLGGVKMLCGNEGMLYAYPHPDFYVHNMKGMLFPLDIIWISKDKKIVDVIENVEPGTYPDFAYVNDFLAQYVLEIRAGFFDAHKLKIGDTVWFEVEETMPH